MYIYVYLNRNVIKTNTHFCNMTSVRRSMCKNYSHCYPFEQVISSEHIIAILLNRQYPVLGNVHYFISAVSKKMFEYEIHCKP